MKILGSFATIAGFIADMLAIYAFLTTGNITAELPNAEIEIVLSRDGIALLNLAIGAVITGIVSAQSIKGKRTATIIILGLFFGIVSLSLWGLTPGINIDVTNVQPGLITDTLNSFNSGEQLVGLFSLVILIPFFWVMTVGLVLWIVEEYK